MPNILDSAGLQIATQQEIKADLTASLQTIYGPDINLTQSSPDGQLMNTFSQATLDTEDLIAQVYATFDPDQAVGVVLDQRIALNGIERLAATFSTVVLNVVVTQGLTLFGLDQPTQTIFIAQDSQGNQWKLITTQSPTVAGTYSYTFQAANSGAVLALANTITSQATITPGVTSVNNPSPNATTGAPEESESAVRIRRQQRVAFTSQGFYPSLKSALLGTSGVTYAFVEENIGSTTNGDGVPGHTIWVVVGGTATPANIATAIYQKRNSGCGMYGNQSYTVTQPDGTPFTVSWDDVTSEALFIKFTLTSIDGVTPPDIAAIRSSLPNIFLPGVYQRVNTTDLGTLIQAIDDNSLVTNSGFSTSSGGSYTALLTPATKKQQFLVSSPNIIVLPMQVTGTGVVVSVVSDVVHTAITAVRNSSKTFSALGGFGTYNYGVTSSIGSTINSSTGVYTAGSSTGTDTVTVTDALANTATITITVT